MAIKSLLITILISVITTNTHAESPRYSWQVSELARSAVEKIRLRNDQDRLLKTISAKQMVYLYAAMSSMSEASEIQAELLIVDGKLANAFAATTEENHHFIAINFALLDIVATDMDMAAALIGHELAHLKLNHGEINKKNITLNHGKDFSAANTRYSRDNERDADYLGAIWAVEAGYDADGAVALQEELYKLSKNINASSFNVSHPSSIERITVLKSLARRLQK
jgi:predicted Zn-dependent protease